MPVGWVQLNEQKPGVTPSPSLVAKRITAQDFQELNSFQLNEPSVVEDESIVNDCIESAKMYRFTSQNPQLVLPNLIVQGPDSTSTKRIPKTPHPNNIDW